MKVSAIAIARRFCEELLSERHAEQLTDLDQYFANGGSVCALARKGPGGLVREFGLQSEDAQALALRLNGLATWVLRRFIDAQLPRAEPPPEHLRRGLLGLVDGPTYDGLFKPGFDRKCPSDAIEAIHSPVAYAVWLKHWSESRLIPSEPTQAFRLDGRRPDLDTLRIDPVTARGVVSSVEVVSAVLEKSISDSLGDIHSLNEVLSTRRYPNGLPYHHPWTTVDEFIKELGLSVGSVVRLCDPQSPYFLRALPWGRKADDSLTQAARLSPSLREVLTEPPHFPIGDEDWEEYFKANYGTVNVEALNLNQVPFFNERTKLARSELEALLSIELFSPSRSANAPVFIDEVTPGHAGSVFINDGAASLPLGIDHADPGTPIFMNRISQTTNDRFDRLNRKIRLDNALQLPSHETDALLKAFIDAEHPGADPDYRITGNTLRAFGLFQVAREYYQCPAEDFAAIFGVISIFGRGTEPSQFDRVFNKDSLSMPALLLDDGPFEVVPTSSQDALTIVQICSGLNIDLATYFTLAPLIASVHGLEKLKRSITVISSFYRLSRLPQILGIAPILAVEILNLLSGDAWLAALVGKPRINAQARSEEPDVLSEIQRLEGWVRWCANSGLDATWALEHVNPMVAPSEPSPAQTQLFEQLSAQIVPALFTETALQVAGVPALSNNRQWTNLLLALADQAGRVIHWAESPDESYEQHARSVIEHVVLQAIGRDDQAIVKTIVQVLLASRAGQHSVVRESLAVYGGLASGLALAVLSWSGGTVYEVLSSVVGLPSVQSPVGARQREGVPGDPFLGLLDGFIRRSEVVKELKLSVEFLDLYLNIGDGVSEPPASGSFSPSALYYLTVYNRAVALSQDPETRLLDYLRRVSGLAGSLSGDGLALVKEYTAKWLADLFDWSTEEVRACADHVNAAQGYIRTLEHLDLFTRVRAFALQSQLNAPLVLELGTLDPEASFYAYETLADRISSVLADPDRTSPLYGIDPSTNEVAVGVEVDKAELFANSVEFALLTVTVTRTGIPQKNVNVYWSSALCRVEPAMSTTDMDGQAVVNVFAGTSVGRDLISYRLDAREAQHGVAITLRNDPSTFAFYKLASEVDIRQEKVGNDVTLRIELLDKYENPAIHESVSWTLEPLLLVPVSTLTNDQGVAELTFSSPFAVTIPAPKVLAHSAGYTFKSLEFIE